MKEKIASIPAVRRFLLDQRFEYNNARDFSNLFTHENMLADRVRLGVYERAIDRYVKPGDVAIDLGTGTGILSLLACRKSPEKVYALDHSPVMRIAEKIAASHDSAAIRFIEKNSFDFNEKIKADVIIHDQIGDLLFEENLITAVSDLRDRFLKPGGRILPARFEFFLEPVKIKDEFHIPFLHENRYGSVDFKCLGSESGRGPAIRDLWFDQIDLYFSEEKPVHAFDLHTLQPDQFPKSFFVTRDILKSGRMDGFLFYFKMYFDEDIALKTDFSHPWLSWTRQLLRCESRELKAGQKMDLNFSIPHFQDTRQWAWSYNVRL